MTPPSVRRAEEGDTSAIWAVLEPAFRAGDTYTVDPDISAEDAIGYWFASGNSVFVAERGGRVVGTYYLRRNHGGGGSHVCNCGFVTDRAAWAQGVARAMVEHALTAAKETGYRAMQFNFVVSNNARAVLLWQSYGFETVGRLPEAFRTPGGEFVDSLVMYRRLDQS